MKIHRGQFYARLRKDTWLFQGGLRQTAIDTLDAILDETELRGITDYRLPAYMMSTARGEVGVGMSPVREGFSQSDAQARAYVKKNFPRYSMIVNGHMYYGRGLVQLTWERNYIVMGTLLGIDLKNNPDMALESGVAVQILFEGMMRGVSGKGDFTGKALEDYFNSTIEDWVNARRIINGVDRAQQFAAFGRRFYQHLQASLEVDVPTPAAQPAPPEQPEEPYSPFRKALGWLSGLYGVIGSSIMGVVAWLAEQPYPISVALIAGVAVASVGVFALIWLYPRPIVISR